MNPKNPYSIVKRPLPTAWVVLTHDELYTLLSRAHKQLDRPREQWIAATADDMAIISRHRRTFSSFVLLKELPDAEGRPEALSLARSLDAAAYESIERVVRTKLDPTELPETVQDFCSVLHAAFTKEIRFDVRTEATKYATKCRFKPRDRAGS